MHRTLSNLAPALMVAVATLGATALVVMAPRAPWSGVAGPLLLVTVLLGADAFRRRRAGRGALPALTTLLLAAAILAGCAIVASRDLRSLAEMMPVFGSCAAVPLIPGNRGARSRRESTCSPV
jgi:hypothetical protein